MKVQITLYSTTGKYKPISTLIDGSPSNISSLLAKKKKSKIFFIGLDNMLKEYYNKKEVNEV